MIFNFRTEINARTIDRGTTTPQKIRPRRYLILSRVRPGAHNTTNRCLDDHSAATRSVLHGHLSSPTEMVLIHSRNATYPLRRQIHPPNRRRT